jgi:hypothetical protein
MDRLRILISGMVAADPHQGGATWAVLQYVLGFRKLGHEVTLVEPVPRRSLRPEGCGLAGSKNARYFHEVMRSFHLDRHSALLLEGTRETEGLTYERLRRVAGEADLLINVSGMLTDTELIGRVPVRAYLDLDPAFIQLWHATQGVDMRFGGHTHFVTVGLNVGFPGCPVPTCGLHWITTTQPVVLDLWPPASPVPDGAFTTVANWRGYGSIEYQGVHHGQKAHSWRRFMDLPNRTAEAFSPAINIHPGDAVDVAALAGNGWSVLDPARVAGTPEAYRGFIRGSKGELGIAKSGYVVSRSGWFSDRSAAYLASGRPVIAQGTGFESHLPTGAGLFSFDTAEDVLASLDAIHRDPVRHSQAARELAVEYFGSDTVLSGLVEQLLGIPETAL